jgi:hypothetical protein
VPDDQTLNGACCTVVEVSHPSRKGRAWPFEPARVTSDGVPRLVGCTCKSESEASLTRQASLRPSPANDDRPNDSAVKVKFSSYRRLVAAIVVAVAVSALLAVFGTQSAKPATARTMGTCWISSTYTAVHPSTRSGYADSTVICDPGYPTYAWTLKFINDAGSALMTSSGYFDDSDAYSTPEVGCAGAYVRANMYINVGGTGKSDTEGRQAC